ncbi:MAG: Gx transporter family protein [Clostridia bacterium]
MKYKLTSKKIASLGVLSALGLIMFMVESLFPPLFIPGAKMGLSNIFSLLTLILMSPLDAVIVVVVRTVIGSFFFGSMSTLIYSLSAGLVSVLVSSLLYKLLFPKITLIAISAVAAVVHNLTQNLIFCLVTNTPQMFVYMPYLAVLGVIAGVLVGIAVKLIVRYLPTDILLKFE